MEAYNQYHFAGILHAHLAVFDPLPGQAVPLYYGLHRLRRGYHGRSPSLEVPGSHWVSHLLQGSGRIQLGPDEPWQRWNAGQALLLDSDDPWPRYQYDGEAPGLRQALIFQGDQARALARQLRKRYGPVFSLANDHPACAALADIGRSARGVTRKIYPAMLPQQAHGLVQALLLALWDGCQARFGDDVVVRAMDVLRTESNLPIAAVAKRLGCSPEHLSRRFAARIGQSPAHWRRAQQLDQVFPILVAGEMSNGEAARRCGYASVQGFLKAFRLRFGRTPSGRLVGSRLGES